LRRRVPGSPSEDCEAAFGFLCDVYDRAKEAILSRLSTPLEQVGKTVEFHDIDYDACLAILDQIEPGVAMAETRWILNWCIFWYYLK
jgi:hypothetical protein